MRGLGTEGRFCISSQDTKDTLSRLLSLIPLSHCFIPSTAKDTFSYFFCFIYFFATQDKLYWHDQATGKLTLLDCAGDLFLSDTRRRRL